MKMKAERWTRSKAETEAKRAEITALYKQGAGTKRISAVIGIPYQNIAKALTRWGIYEASRFPGGYKRGIAVTPGLTVVKKHCLKSAELLILAAYKSERRASEAPDRAWGLIWDREKSRLRAAEEYARDPRKILDYQKGLVRKRLNTDPSYRDKLNARHRAWNGANIERNRGKAREYARKWAAANPDKAREIRRRASRNPVTKIAHSLRKRVKQIIKHSAEKGSELTGCTGAYLKAHIERHWRKGMTWSNHGEWHIGHIIPCAKFNLRDPLQRRACFHFTNLRPLWAEDNMRKADSMDRDMQMALPIAA